MARNIYETDAIRLVKCPIGLHRHASLVYLELMWSAQQKFLV
jgi:hypothetical protein